MSNMKEMYNISKVVYGNRPPYDKKKKRITFPYNTSALNPLVIESNDTDESNSEIGQDKSPQNENNNPANPYLHTGKNEDHIQVRGLGDTENDRKPVRSLYDYMFNFVKEQNESHEKDIEENISLKARQEEAQKGKRSSKVLPEKKLKPKKNPFEKNVTFLNASIDDLKERKVGEFRLFVAQIMRSKIVDYFILVLIVLYTLLVVVYLAIDTIISQYPNVELGLEIVELVFLTIFVIEITMNFIAFGCLFVKDYWNIVDVTVIFIAIGLVVLDINYSGQNLDALLRLRGLFRLVRIGILLRKFDSIRKKSMARKQLFNRDFYHVMAPSEIVNNILCNIRDMIQNDAKLLEDINYCIKMVSSGKLYETNFGEGEGDDTDDKRKDAMSWVKSIQGKSKDEKRGSAVSSGANNKRVSTIEVNDKLELTPAASLMLESVNKLDFNIFEFKDEVNERELYVLSTFLLQKHGLFESCKIDPDVYTKFIQRIQDYYNPSWIEYHNKTHGSDVCQTSYFFLNGCDFISIGKVTDLELAGILIAASCHDFEHPGFNNFFLVESRAPWAIEYNDKSPLENHHISATFSLIERPEFNIFKELEVKEFKEIRKNMIEIVLATDSANHFTEVAKLKQRISAEDFCPFGDDKLTVIKMMVHLADISNPVKNFELAFIWTGLLYDEFFKQGDRESELGRDISFLMDRKTINIAGSSIGFSKMLVQPAYEALASIIPMAQICVDNLGANIAKWEELKNDFEQKKINGDNYIEESRGKIKQKTSFPSPNRPSIIASFKADRESLESNRMHNSLLNS